MVGIIWEHYSGLVGIIWESYSGLVGIIIGMLLREFYAPQIIITWSTQGSLVYYRMEFVDLPVVVNWMAVVVGPGHICFNT